MLGCEPEIHEEANRLVIVADQIAHQDFDYVVIEHRHTYTD